MKNNIKIYIFCISVLIIGTIIFTVLIALRLKYNSSSTKRTVQTISPIIPKTPSPVIPKTPSPVIPKTPSPEIPKTPSPEIPTTKEPISYFPKDIGVVTLDKLPLVECNSVKKNCDNGINCNSPVTPIKFWLNNTEYDNVNAKIHGNATSTWEKKSYNIKFDKKIKLVDYIPKSKNYILYAPYYEYNKYQNALSYYLSNSINFPAPKCYPVFLWINENGPEKTGEDWINYNNKTTLQAQKCNNKIINGGDKPFRGLYWIINKIDEHMMDLQDTDYLIQFDRGLCCKDVDGLIKNFSPFGFNMYNNAYKLGMSRPIIEFSGKSVKEDAGTLLTRFVEKLFSSNGSSDEPSDEAMNMVDFESWAKYFILSELFNSVDAYFYSTNMSIRYDEKSGNYRIFMGPVWDYNEAFSTCSSYTACRDGGNPKFWKYAKQWFTFKYNSPRYCVPEFYARILMSTKFRNYVISTYQNLRKNELSNDTILSLCSRFEKLVVVAANADLNRWNKRLNSIIKPDNSNLPDSQKTYWNIINWSFSYIKSYIQTRLSWLDQNMKNGPSIDKSGTNLKSLGLEFGKNIPKNQKSPYEGSCVQGNNFSECDVQNNTGFFYGKYAKYL